MAGGGRDVTTNCWAAAIPTGVDDDRRPGHGTECCRHAMVLVPRTRHRSVDGHGSARRVCVGAGAGVLLDLMIPVKGPSAGAVLADQHARKVGGLAFHPNSTAAVRGPAMLAPLTPDTPAAALVVARAPGPRPSTTTT